MLIQWLFGWWSGGADGITVPGTMFSSQACRQSFSNDSTNFQFSNTTGRPTYKSEALK